MSSTAVEPCNCGIATDKADVEDNGNEGEEGDTAEEESEEHCKEEVQDRSPRHALNGANPCFDRQFVS